MTGQDFETLDEALTAANLALARARAKYADGFRADAAREHDAAWERADSAGDAYLAARFEHEARCAGLYTDPEAFEDPDVEPKAFIGRPAFGLERPGAGDE